MDDSVVLARLYDYDYHLTHAQDKSEYLKYYMAIVRASKGSTKAKQLAAQLIPKFFKYFPSLSGCASDAHFDLLDAEDLAVRVQAIRGLPFFSKDTPEYVPKVVDVLGQYLIPGENVDHEALHVEREAVSKALMSLLKQDIKASLTALFEHIQSTDKSLRAKIICFIRERVFPLKAELLKPQEQMERHITNLVKRCLKDLTTAQFTIFMDFLIKTSLFGQGASIEHVQEFVELAEEHAFKGAEFNVSDGDHIDRFLCPLSMALPFFTRGASNGKFLNYLNMFILPVFDKIPEERKLDLLKNLAESSPYTTPLVSRELLPSVFQLLKSYMPGRNTREEINYTYVECLLYTFHNLAQKTPNATNSLCGYKIVTGQPSDRLGEDFSDNYKDFTERLSNMDGFARATVKKSTQEVVELDKVLASANMDEVKDIIKSKKKKTVNELFTCKNILEMTKPLHLKSPSFIGDKRINLSWKAVMKPSALSTAAAALGVKRNATVAYGSSTNATKRSRDASGVQNQLRKALEGLPNGRRGRGGRGMGRDGRARGRGCF